MDRVRQCDNRPDRFDGRHAKHSGACHPGGPGSELAPKKKKRDKGPDAWFSFIGRIVAQIIGAVASVALAIMFLQRSQDNEPTTASTTSPAAPLPARAARADGRVTIAVLPLANYSGGTQQDFFADGMTEALIADLAQIEGLRVISRTSVMQYRNTQKPLPQVASELGADVIVEGSVLRVGDRVRDICACVRRPVGCLRAAHDQARARHVHRSSRQSAQRRHESTRAR